MTDTRFATHTKSQCCQCPNCCLVEIGHLERARDAYTQWQYSKLTQGGFADTKEGKEQKEESMNAKRRLSIAVTRARRWHYEHCGFLNPGFAADGQASSSR